MSRSSNNAPDRSDRLTNWPIASACALVVTVLICWAGVIQGFFHSVGNLLWQSLLLAVAVGLLIGAYRLYKFKQSNVLAAIMAIVAVVLAVWALSQMFSLFMSVFGVIFLGYVIGVVIALDIRCIRELGQHIIAAESVADVFVGGFTRADLNSVLLWPASLAGVDFSGAYQRVRRTI